MGILRAFLNGGFRATTPENPTFDLNSDDAWDALGARPTSTGESVSAEGALTFSPWFRGVSLLARDLAKTPLEIYKYHRRRGEQKEIDAEHPAYHLLRWKCNDFQTVFHFRQAIVGHAVNRGNGYAYIDRDLGGDPIAMTLLDPDKTEPVKHESGFWYVVELPSGDKRKIRSADIFHLRGFGFDGIRGYPAFELARDAIAVGRAHQKYKGLRFKNAARPAVVLESPNPIKADTRQSLRKDWEAMHTGLENSHKTAILDNGLKLSRIAFTADEMQEVANAELTIRDVSNFLHIPASKLGDAGAVKYKSKEDDDQSYLGDGLDYWFFAFEDEARDKLLSEKQKQKETHCVIFDRKSLIRADLAAKTTYWTKALGGMPWAIANEARADFDLEPRDEPEANKLQPPLNMGQGGEKNVPKNPADRAVVYPDYKPTSVEAIDAFGVNEAAKTMIADTCRRVVTRLGSKGSRAASKPDEYLAWLDALAVDDATRAAFAPAEQLVTSIRGSCPDLAEAALVALRSSLEATPSATAVQLPAAVETAMASAQETVGSALLAKIWST